MKEEIISFETAKLAKKKGFNINVGKVYVDKDNQEPFYTPSFTGVTTGIVYAVPTQSLLQRWLREKHNLYVIVDTIHTLIGTEVIRVEWKWSITSDKDDDIKCIWNGKETYEQALEAGLQEALKLIKGE